MLSGSPNSACARERSASLLVCFETKRNSMLSTFLGIRPICGIKPWCMATARFWIHGRVVNRARPGRALCPHSKPSRFPLSFEVQLARVKKTEDDRGREQNLLYDFNICITTCVSRSCSSVNFCLKKSNSHNTAAIHPTPHPFLTAFNHHSNYLPQAST